MSVPPLNYLIYLHASPFVGAKAPLSAQVQAKCEENWLRIYFYQSNQRARRRFAMTLRRNVGLRQVRRELTSPIKAFF